VVHGNGIRIPAKQLRRVRDGPGGILGSSNLEIVSMNSNLLESEGLSCIFGSLEVNEGIVAVSADPHTDHWLILEDADFLAHLLEGTIKELHQLHISQVLRDVADIKLPLGFVMVGQALARVELLVVLKDLLRGHLGLDLFRGPVREVVQLCTLCLGSRHRLIVILRVVA
jgi:hypothetical protein